MERNVKVLENILGKIKSLPVEDLKRMSKDLNEYVVNFSLSKEYNISKVNIVKFLFYDKVKGTTEIIYRVLLVGLFNEEVRTIKDFNENEYDNLLIFLSNNKFVVNKFIDDTMVD